MGYRKRKRSAPVLSTASAGCIPRGHDPGPYRTPIHVGDPHASDESYTVEGIMAQMLVRGASTIPYVVRSINASIRRLVVPYASESAVPDYRVEVPGTVIHVS